MSTKPCVVACHLPGQPARMGLGADEQEQRVGVDGLVVAGVTVPQHEVLEMLDTATAHHLGAEPDVDAWIGVDLAHEVVGHAGLE